MQSNEIKFTSDEMKLMHNEGFMILKRTCIDKVVALYGILKLDIESSVEELGISQQIPYTRGDVKMAKGENYRSLPYVSMDYPRSISGNSIFLFRSMFWWGHFFSFTLHLQGTCLNAYRENLMEVASSGELPGDAFISVGNSPWHYHYEPSNYRQVSGMERDEILSTVKERKFIKLSFKYPLYADGSKVVAAGRKSFERLMRLILPADGIV